MVGVNAYTEAEPSPLTTGEGSILTVDASVERGQIARLKAWRAERDGAAVTTALAALEAAAREDRNIMPPSIACAQAGVTTGEWAEALRAVFGEYRAPTGVARAVGVSDGRLDARGARSRRFHGGSAGASRSWSASPGSTAIPTAPSRSPCAPAIAAWRWSMRASA